MFENEMDINIKCILSKKCLGFDRMHFRIIMLIFSIPKHWAEIDSPVQWAEEKLVFFPAPGLEDNIAVCYLFS